MPELVRSKVTGLVCERSEELPDALRALERLAPADCVACASRHRNEVEQAHITIGEPPRFQEIHDLIR
ncbi:hypothetical protein [Micromonospora zamorensis]|uniref:hypothetical protein n=1 Tax=Micromonospora zamorensis TaxID=709883 RepID=UPI003CE72453